MPCYIILEAVIDRLCHSFDVMHKAYTALSRRDNSRVRILSTRIERDRQDSIGSDISKGL